jgi:hypothetical protein
MGYLVDGVMGIMLKMNAWINHGNVGVGYTYYGALGFDTGSYVGRSKDTRSLLFEL